MPALYLGYLYIDLWFAGEGERNAEQLGIVDLSDENDEVSDGQHCAVPREIRKPTFQSINHVY